VKFGQVVDDGQMIVTENAEGFIVSNGGAMVTMKVVQSEVGPTWWLYWAKAKPDADPFEYTKVLLNVRKELRNRGVTEIYSHILDDEDLTGFLTGKRE